MSMRGGQSSSFLVTTIVVIQRKDTGHACTGLTCGMSDILLIHTGSHFLEWTPYVELWKIVKLLKIVPTFYFIGVCT